MVNWTAVAATASVLGLFITILSAVFVAGRFSREIAENRDNIKDHMEMLKDHGTRLNDHDVQLGRMAEWKSGFNSAARLSGAKEVS